MTVSNRKGSVTKELTLNVGTCRTDYEQMGLHARSRSYDSLTFRSDANKLVFSESLTVATSDFTLCLPRGEYWVNVTRTMKSYLEEDYDINFTDNDGDVIEARSDDAVHGGGGDRRLRGEEDEGVDEGDSGGRADALHASVRSRDQPVSAIPLPVPLARSHFRHRECRGSRAVLVSADLLLSSVAPLQDGGTPSDREAAQEGTHGAGEFAVACLLYQLWHPMNPQCTSMN